MEGVKRGYCKIKSLFCGAAEVTPGREKWERRNGGGQAFVFRFVREKKI